MSEVPRRSVTRAARLAGLPLGIAGRAAVGLGRRMTGGDRARILADQQARTAEQLFAVLGDLKGGAMKFGQTLSVFEAAVPEHLAAPFRDALTRLQQSGPPMPAATVHAVLAEALGTDWRSLFREFDEVPVGAASIGQVHRGVWEDGRDVAVKVQYPGAPQAITSDVRQFSRAARVAGGWIPGLDLGPILEELRDRLVEELDYRHEALAQQEFADGFRNDPHVVVPDVVHQARSVIVSTWLEGRPMAQVIADGTEEERDALGVRYLDFLLGGPDRVGLLHADPHPGNFRLMEDGRLGVLDFGAVDRLPDGLPPEMGRLLGVALRNDADTLAEGLREEGFIRHGIDLPPEDVLAVLEPFVAPLRVESFHFTRDWLREVFGEIQDPRGTQFGISVRLNLPPQYLLLHRTWLGGIGVLSQLGATVPTDVVFAHLDGLDAGRD